MFHKRVKTLVQKEFYLIFALITILGIEPCLQVKR